MDALFTILPLFATLATLLGVLLAGKHGWFRKDGTGYPFRTWRLRLSCTPIDTTNFLSEGYSEFIAGFITGECTASGFIDPALQLRVGDSATVSLGVGRSPGAAGINYHTTFTGVILDLTASTAVDRAGEVEVMLRTNGEFDITFTVS